MICKYCGKEIPDGSTFCSHCGNNLSKPSSLKGNRSANDQIPLVMIFNQIIKHKIAVAVFGVLAILCISGYYFYKKHQEKVLVEKAVQEIIERYKNILGTYETVGAFESKTIDLYSDNTVYMVVDRGKYDERRYRGYWTEDGEGYPIEINLSDSYDGNIGSKRRYSCSTLYIHDGRLWESMSAIRSHDYGASETLQKK